MLSDWFSDLSFFVPSVLQEHPQVCVQILTNSPLSLVGVECQMVDAFYMFQNECYLSTFRFSYFTEILGAYGPIMTWMKFRDFFLYTIKYLIKIAFAENYLILFYLGIEITICLSINRPISIY